MIERLQRLPVILPAAALAASAALAAEPSGGSPQAAPAAPQAQCREALVNPVSGHAECVDPPGAPVEPPPPRPGDCPAQGKAGGSTACGGGSSGAADAPR